MKWMPKVFYGVFIFLATVVFYNNSEKLQFRKFYEFEALEAIEQKDYDKYFETFFTATKMTDKYSTTPLYEGIGAERFNFKIMQSMTNDTLVNWFYLADDVTDYSVFLDESEEKLLEGNFTRIMYTIEVFMKNDEESPITNYFYINPESKDVRQPLPLMQFHLTEDDKLTYYYSSNDKDNKVSYKQSDTISRIEIFFTLDHSSLDKPIKNKIIEISHGENNNNELDNLSFIDGVYYGNSFNGQIDKHDLRENFKNDDDFIKTVEYSSVKKYFYIRRNYMLKVIGIELLITYLIFFLRPTIDLIKNKLRENRQKKKALKKTDK